MEERSVKVHCASPIRHEADHKGNISSRWATTMTCGALAPKLGIWEDRQRPHEVLVCCKLAMGKYWTSHIHCNKGVNRFYQSITTCSRFGMFVPFFLFQSHHRTFPSAGVPLRFVGRKSTSQAVQLKCTSGDGSRWHGARRGFNKWLCRFLP